MLNNHFYPKIPYFVDKITSCLVRQNARSEKKNRARHVEFPDAGSTVSSVYLSLTLRLQAVSAYP